MDKLLVFSATNARGRIVHTRPFRTESELQHFVVRHAERLLGLRMLAREYPIDSNGGGRLDALGIDAKFAPAVLEFKRTATGLTICQGLYYLDWLDRHREVFSALVLRRLGRGSAAQIAWDQTRLLCLAENIDAREEAVARQIGRRVELLQLRRYSRGVVTIQRAALLDGQ